MLLYKKLPLIRTLGEAFFEDAATTPWSLRKEYKFPFPSQ